VHWRKLPAIEGAWILVYSMPAKTTEKSFPFKLKDVPMP